MLSLKLIQSCLIKTITHTCVGCLTAIPLNHVLCQACLNDITINENPCKQCGCALKLQFQSTYCGACIRHPPSFDTTIAPYCYSPPLSIFITQCKFHGKQAYGAVLANWLLQSIQAHYENTSYPDALAPVPLHQHRLRQRGYNQSMLIALQLSRQLNIPIITEGIYRRINTIPQATLPSKQRQKNVNQAFVVHKPFTDQHIAIIDDVMTTGHTVNALTKALKKSGAKRVSVWAIARARLTR